MNYYNWVVSVLALSVFLTACGDSAQSKKAAVLSKAQEISELGCVIAKTTSEEEGAALYKQKKKLHDEFKKLAETTGISEKEAIDIAMTYSLKRCK